MTKTKKHTLLSWLLGTAILAGAGAGPTNQAQAHFQLLHTPQVIIGKPATLPFKLVFTHPFENGQAMDMGLPDAFFYVHKGERVDLKDSLAPIVWQSGTHNKAAAFEAAVPVKRNGDYVFVVIPSPYLEESEDLYIQQIAKSFVNKGGMPSDWSAPVGLPTEIVPFNKPYNVIAGSTFSGRVLSDGKPVPGAEIEIEFMAAPPDMENNRPGPVSASPPPGGAVAAIADADGVFTFGIPKAGFWGFAALDVGPDKEYQGKKLSQDAVIWIHAHELQ